MSVLTFLKSKKIVLLILSLALVIGGYFLPIWKIRNVVVDGNKQVSAQEIKKAIHLPQDLIFSRVNKQEIGTRVLTIPWVQSVRVTRRFPSTIRINVVERIPLAVYRTLAGKFLVDSNGIMFTSYSGGNYPEIILPPSASPTGTLSEPDRIRLAISVIMHIKNQQVLWLRSVSVDEFGYIIVNHVNNTVSKWGFGDDLESKAATLKILMTQKGKEYNVSNFRLPTIK